MKQYLILICLLLLPFSSYADLKPEKKFSFLEESEKHKKEALNELSDADNMCLYIPNLEKRDHMHVLIASVITSVSIPDPKLKLLSVGLALIGSLANDMYDTYCEL